MEECCAIRGRDQVRLLGSDVGGAGERGGHTNELPPRTLSSWVVHSLDFQGLVSGYCQQIPGLVGLGVVHLLPPKSAKVV